MANKISKSRNNSSKKNKNQPERIVATRNTIDVLALVVGVLLMCAATAFVIIKWGSLPDMLPTKFDADGNAIAYGEHGSLIFTVVMAWFINMCFNVFVSLPDMWEEFLKVKPGKKSEAFRIIKYMLEAYQVSMAFWFTYSIIGQTLCVPLPTWPTVLFIGVLIAVTIIGVSYIKKLAR